MRKKNQIIYILDEIDKYLEIQAEDEICKILGVCNKKSINNEKIKELINIICFIYNDMEILKEVNQLINNKSYMDNIL